MSWTAFIDGGSRGNPGPAAAGVQIMDQAGTVVFAGGFFLGRLTNNQAEYRGLLAALDLLGRADADSITIATDSELMVRQITGVYRVKSAVLKPLFDKARQRLLQFDHWQIQHILRERNTRADRLANQAMDAGRDVVVTDRLGLHDTRRTEGASPARRQEQADAHAVEVFVTRGPGRRLCPGGVRRGQLFVFTEVTPAGLCVDACTAVIDAVLALRDAGRETGGRESVMTPRCGKAGCGAVFEVRLRRRG